MVNEVPYRIAKYLIQGVEVRVDNVFKETRYIVIYRLFWVHDYEIECKSEKGLQIGLR
jgi:hypothetical protein